MPKFKLNKEKITTKDIWLHMFKEMGNMEKIDESVYDRADEGLLRLIEKAKVAALSEEEQKLYDASMKVLEDEIDMEEHGFKRGLKQGIAQGRAEGESKARQQIISNLRQVGFSDEKIAEMTKIPLEEITRL